MRHKHVGTDASAHRETNFYTKNSLPFSCHLWWYKFSLFSRSKSTKLSYHESKSGTSRREQNIRSSFLFSVCSVLSLDLCRNRSAKWVKCICSHSDSLRGQSKAREQSTPSESSINRQPCVRATYLRVRAQEIPAWKRTTRRLRARAIHEYSTPATDAYAQISN